MTYIVQKGDILSELARVHRGIPIYGKKASLHQLISWNPQIANPDRIFVGDEIFFDTTPPVIETRVPASEDPIIPAAIEKNPGSEITIETSRQVTARPSCHLFKPGAFVLGSGWRNNRREYILTHRRYRI